MFETMFETILRLSIMSSVLIGIILLTKAIFKDSLNAHWHYYIWFLVILRLIVPYTPESSVSIFNFLPQISQQIEEIEGIQQSHDASPINEDAMIAKNLTNVSLPTEEKSVEIIGEENVIAFETGEQKDVSFKLNYESIIIIWIIGVIIILLVIATVNIRFHWKLKKQPKCKEDALLNILEECKAKLKITSNVSIIYDDTIKTPSIVGMVFPKLLMPKQMVNELSRDEIKYVILHELTHLKRKDVFINGVAILLQAIHWFNPLVWYAFQKMRTDCEIACDAKVLSYLEKNEHLKYGQTIINVLSKLSKTNLIPITVGMASNNITNIKRRIWRIKMFKKTSKKWSAIAVLLAVAIGIVGLTNSIDTPVSANENKLEFESLDQMIFSSDQWLSNKVSISSEKNIEDSFEIVTMENGLKRIETRDENENGKIDAIFIKFTQDIDPSTLLESYFTVEGYQIKDVRFEQKLDGELLEQLIDRANETGTEVTVAEEYFENVKTNVIINVVELTEFDGAEMPVISIAEKVIQDMDGHVFAGMNKTPATVDNVFPYTKLKNASFKDQNLNSGYISGTLTFETDGIEYDTAFYDVFLCENECNGKYEVRLDRIWASGNTTYSVEIEEFQILKDNILPLKIAILPVDASGNSNSLASVEVQFHDYSSIISDSIHSESDNQGIHEKTAVNGETISEEEILDKYPIIENKIYHVYVKEEFFTKGVVEDKPYIERSGYTINGIEGYAYPSSLVIAVPKEITNLKQAREYLVEMNSDQLQLPDSSIIHDSLIKQWELEQYDAVYEYWEESPKGLSVEDIK
ncbi:M56 family metallopeptidase [Chengkuizengella axinellae]|uniref:M56 family metallopeptidase n=1 Tax=Chengkuizengella axinellae TaxID=3064388 RepID=A0ABT9J445_9BACL|nr:M56 family metallopeptidase [Chengkuizengella sp. 2205SS18-9]MDP5276406.1 M56 family metallopeptidase [Chengkuizengella sp. 2205SS18-9]